MNGRADKGGEHTSLPAVKNLAHSASLHSCENRSSRIRVRRDKSRIRDGGRALFMRPANNPAIRQGTKQEARVSGVISAGAIVARVADPDARMPDLYR